MIQEKKDEDGEKYLTVDTEDDWHEALRRGRRIETPVQLAGEIGVPMNEDVGTLDDILAAGSPWGWPPFLSLFGKFGIGYSRRVTDELSRADPERCCAVAEALGARQTLRSGEFRDRQAIHRRQQCLSDEPGHQTRVWRQPLGHSSTD